MLDELKPYHPLPVTLDFLAKYLRALKTSQIVLARFDPATREGVLELAGSADLPTKFYVFESPAENPVSREWEAEPFQGKIVVPWRAEKRE